MKKHTKILILALCCALLFSTGVLAADSVKKTIEATYRGIKLVVDGVPVTPKDANGSVVEPFIYNGTTYLPVRAVGEALGKTVSWDGATSTVYIGNVPGENIYLMKVCPPYQYTGSGSYRAYTEENGETFSMSGKTYTNGIVLRSDAYGNNGYALFNLEGAYNTLTFDFGHVDEIRNGHSDGVMKLYLDGELAETISMKPDELAKTFTIDLNGALQLKIETNYTFCSWGFGNMTVR